VPDTTQVTPERRITLRLPSILAARIDQEIAKRRAEQRKFSLNDWITEACRVHLDGGFPPQPNYSIYPKPNGPPLQPPAEVHLGFPAVEIDSFDWDEWTRKSKALDPEAREDSFRETLRDRQAVGLVLPPEWGKMSPGARMAWLRINDGGSFGTG
jgi:hypothetical protein